MPMLPLNPLNGACTLPLPEPSAGQVRVKVHVCGVCRTDLHVVEGELPASTRPIVPGHEIGRHRGPTRARSHTTQRRRSCGHCMAPSHMPNVPVLSGWARKSLCVHATFSGYHVHGGYAEYALVSENFAYPIPAIFSDEEAAPSFMCGNYRLPRLTPQSGPTWPAARALWLWRLSTYYHSNRPALGL